MQSNLSKDIEEARKLFVSADFTKEFKGLRFKNDEYVIRKLEENPQMSLIDALREAAKADYWYEYEKDYSDHYFEDTNTDQEFEYE